MGLHFRCKVWESQRIEKKFTRAQNNTSLLDLVANMLHSIVFVVVILCAEESLALSPYLDVYPNVTEAVQRNYTSPLYFGLMLSLSGDQQSTGALAGVQAALDDINNRDDLLPGYSLHYTLTDSKVSLYMIVWTRWQHSYELQRYSATEQLLWTDCSPSCLNRPKARWL